MKQWTREEWSAHLANWGMSEVRRHVHGDINILIAEGERNHGSPQEIADQMADGIDTEGMENGYYRVIWALDQDGRVQLGQALIFARDHDPEMPITDRRRARTNSALNAAIDFLDMQKKGIKYGQGII